MKKGRESDVMAKQDHLTLLRRKYRDGIHMPRILQSAMELRCPLVEVNLQALKAKPQRSSQDITTCEGSLLRAQTIVEL